MKIRYVPKWREPYPEEILPPISQLSAITAFYIKNNETFHRRCGCLFCKVEIGELYYFQLIERCKYHASSPTEEDIIEPDEIVTIHQEKHEKH